MSLPMRAKISLCPLYSVSDRLGRGPETSLSAIRGIRCGAEKRHAISPLPTRYYPMALTCRWRSRPQHHNRTHAMRH